MDITQEYYKFGFCASYYPVLPKGRKYKEDSTTLVLPSKTIKRPDLGDLKGETALGIPLWMPTGFEIDGELWQLPNEPILTLSTQKKIVSTPLAGNDSRGTVKEFISEGDWTINIEGLCIDPKKQSFPEEQVSLVNHVQEQRQAMIMKNYLTELNDIKKVVVQSFKWKRLVASPYAIGYTLKLISDYDFDLIIK